MPKTRNQKEEEIRHLADDFKQAKSVVFADFDGLTVNESEELRAKLRKEHVSFRVSKKTLLKKAMSDAEAGEADLKGLKGNVAVAFGKEDEVAPAKVLANFSKAHENLHLNFGFLEGVLISPEKIKALASLPSKIELIALTVGTIKAPITGFVNVMAGNLRGLVNVLNAIKGQK